MTESRRLLFGPVQQHTTRNLFGNRVSSRRLLTFGFSPGADLRVNPSDTWDSLRSRLPDDWQPDLIALYLPYATIPRGLLSAPVPVVGLAGHWNLCWHAFGNVLPACDVVVTDPVGVERFSRAGLTDVRPANLYGLGEG